MCCPELESRMDSQEKLLPVGKEQRREGNLPSQGEHCCVDGNTRGDGSKSEWERASL